MAETLPLPENTVGGEAATPPVEIVLDPLQLLTAAEAGFARETPGASFESQLPRGNIVYRNFSPPLELKGLDYWLRLDETIAVSTEGTRYLVKVPPFTEMHQIFLGIFAQQSMRSGEKLLAFLDRAAAYLGVSQQSKLPAQRTGAIWRAQASGAGGRHWSCAGESSASQVSGRLC